MLCEKKAAAPKLSRKEVLVRSKSESFSRLLPALAQRPNESDSDDESVERSLSCCSHFQNGPSLPRRHSFSQSRAPTPSKRHPSGSMWAIRRAPDLPPSTARSRPPSTTSRLTPPSAGRRSTEPFQSIPESVAPYPDVLPSHTAGHRSPSGRPSARSITPPPAFANLPLSPPAAAGMVLRPPPRMRRVSLCEDVPSSAAQKTIQAPRVLPSLRAPDHARRDEVPVKDESVPSMRFPLNAHMVSEKSADSIFGDLQRVLRREGVVFAASGVPLSLQCVWGDILFEAAVVRIPRLCAMHGVHFRRVRGDATAYQTLCRALIEQIKI